MVETTRDIDDFEDVDDWTRVPTKPADHATMLRLARLSLNLSQREAAALMHVPLNSIRNWEQRRSQPDNAAKMLIQMLYTRPEETREILKAAAA